MNEYLFVVHLMIVGGCLRPTCHRDLSADLSIHHMVLDMMWVMKCQLEEEKINRVQSFLFARNFFHLIDFLVFAFMNESPDDKRALHPIEMEKKVSGSEGQRYANEHSKCPINNKHRTKLLL